MVQFVEGVFFSGEFEKFAVRWQSSAACLVAGFLGVLSSELSVFTLVVITVERFYAISNVLQMGKRVRLKQAGQLRFYCSSVQSLSRISVTTWP